MSNMIIYSWVCLQRKLPRATKVKGDKAHTFPTSTKKSSSEFSASPSPDLGRTPCHPVLFLVSSARSSSRSASVHNLYEREKRDSCMENDFVEGALSSTVDIPKFLKSFPKLFSSDSAANLDSLPNGAKVVATESLARKTSSSHYTLADMLKRSDVTSRRMDVRVVYEYRTIIR
ncbi:unnamed protein product [Prunus armeniaca]|nr:unnamed protein product [Prunus armeniaca]